MHSEPLPFLTAQRRPRRRGPARAARRAFALCALALALGACGGAGNEDETPTLIGPGSGGLPVGGNIQSATLQNTAGVAIGHLSYDADYFSATSIGTPNAIDFRMGTLATAAGDVALKLVLISGRPDTPCRFQAALAVRDEGFGIVGGDGLDVLNNQLLEFHEVWLARLGEFRRLDCATLFGNQGVGITVVSAPSNQVGIEQVHFVLNSIRR